MKNLLVLFALVSMSFISCSKSDRNELREKIIEDLSITGSVVIASEPVLDCAQVDLIKEDIAEILKKAPILKDEEIAAMSKKMKKSALTKYVCETSIKYTIPLIVGNAVPTKWECKNPAIDALAELVSSKVCANL